MKKVISLALIFSSVQSNSQLLDRESKFVNQTEHLNYSAPRSCVFEVVVNGKKSKGSFILGKPDCAIEGIDLKMIEPEIAKKIDVLICSMMVPALNTSGKDYFSSCSKKSNVGSNVIFEKCGPRKIDLTELSLEDMVVSVYPGGNKAEYIKNTYQATNNKLYPQKVGLKSALYDLRIVKFEYKNQFPSVIEATLPTPNLKISFSDCVKNH